MTDEPDLQQLQDELYITAFSGQRLCYPRATITVEPFTGEISACVFKIRTVISGQFLATNSVLGPYPKTTMNWLTDEIKRQTYDERKRKLSRSIDNQWPATVFEEWLETSTNEHWMTAEWFQKEKAAIFDDYALLISVHVPIHNSQEEFDREYGEAFAMTKLMHYN